MAGILLENTGSDQARASLARKMASEQAKIAAVNMERARQQDGAAKLKAAEYIPGNIVKDTTVPAGANNYVSEIPQDRRRGGFRLYSDVAEVLMTVVEDTVGRHDTIGGAWSPEVNKLRYGIEGTCACRTNFLAALRQRGMSGRDIHANVNFFMTVPVQVDGAAEILDGLSTPGDFVELRADKDTLVVMSNCPQFYNPCSGWNPTPIRAIEWD
jgi:uncharacterized protein